MVRYSEDLAKRKELRLAAQRARQTRPVFRTVAREAGTGYLNGVVAQKKNTFAPKTTSKPVRNHPAFRVGISPETKN